MKPTRKLNRRSFLGQVAGGAAAMGGALALIGGEARAFQVTDSDPSDPVGRGRGTSGVTDRDPSDPIGRGRGGSGGGVSSGVTDSDTGAGADPAGRGRGGGRSQSGNTGLTDRDSGAGADPAGRGRGSGPVNSANAERCQNNRARLAELERFAREPEGWSDEQIARARAQIFVLRRERARLEAAQNDLQVWRTMQDRIVSIYQEHGFVVTNVRMEQAEVMLAQRIDRALAAPGGQRQEVHRQIAEHRRNLTALGCG
jgi:hypothetical protein